MAVLDVGMFPLNGFQLLDQLRARDPKLKVCFLTSYRDMRYVIPNDFVKHSLEYFLTKPLGITTLEKVINKIISD